MELITVILYENEIHSSFREVDKCVRSILALMSEYPSLSDEYLLFKVSFVLRELMNNSVEHGNNFDSSKLIKCKVSYEGRRLLIEIADEGEGFYKDESYYKEIDFDKRERRRGLKLIEDLNFNVNIEKNSIKLNLDLL